MPIRFSNATSSVLASLGAWLRRKPTTNACAGNATTIKNAAIAAMLSFPDFDQSIGITIAAKTPASAAVIGVGVMFTLMRSCSARTDYPWIACERSKNAAGASRLHGTTLS
ncbi:MAG: hypothetical protein KA144_07640 [Xanthomonadaceae bacterium]|nr:hypothetical protein [Xanthomonadaceae bacterium]